MCNIMTRSELEARNAHCVEEIKREKPVNQDGIIKMVSA